MVTLSVRRVVDVSVPWPKIPQNADSDRPITGKALSIEKNGLHAAGTSSYGQAKRVQSSTSTSGCRNSMRKSEPPSDVSESRPHEEPVRPSLASTAVSLDLDAPEAILGTLLAGRYRLDGVIGQGGMSVIYRAEHVHMRKAFAVKVLHRELSVLPEVAARFEREAIAAASIDHPNVAGATDFGRLGDGSFYLVLEYIAGRSIGELLVHREPLAVERAVHIMRQIAEALVAAHAQGIVHRDLKPENVMIVARPDDANFVKILDFGIAKVVAERGGPVLTRVGSVFGTPHYMSPEQASGGEADARSDLYALGVLAYEMFTGVPPFDDADVGRVLAMQVEQPAPEMPATVDPELREVVRRLLKKAPEDRFQAAADVVVALDNAARRWMAPSEAPPPPTFAPLGIPERIQIGRFTLSRYHLLLGVGVVGALVGMALLGALLKWIWPADKADASAAASVVEVAALPPVSSVVPKLPREVIVARAAVGDDEALGLLAKKAETTPSAEAWLALGRGYCRRGQFTKGMRAYQTAMELDSSLKFDEILQRDVRVAAKEDASAEAALRVASRFLESAGADILYDVWVSTAQKTPTTQLAKQMVYDATVRSKASPALDVALDLRAAEKCHQYESLLSRVILYGDRRVVRLVKPLQLKGGCGPGKRDDCYPCLRDDEELLEAALGEAVQRPEPRTQF